MAEQEEESQASETEAPVAKPSRLAMFAAVGRGAAKSAGSAALRGMLLLFMAILPLALIAYPAWRLSERLVEYAQASTVEAEFTGMDIRTVEINQDQTSLFEARKHIDVVFYFKGQKGQQLASVAEMSWPAPGLKRKLQNQYQAGDKYTLYLLPSHAIEIDDMVAKDLFYRLTGLMALVFLGSAVFSMLWKRLSHRMPTRVPRFPVASIKSLMFGQLISLVVAGAFGAMIYFNPLAINLWLFVGAYWGLVAFISLSLRLLVFDAPPPAPEPQPEEAPKQPRR